MGYNYNQGGVGMPPVAPPTSTNAIISLVAGIVGIIFLACNWWDCGDPDRKFSQERDCE